MTRRVFDTFLVYWLWLKAEILIRIGRPKAAPEGSRTILFVTETMPPYVKMGVYRPLSWMTEGIRTGWNVRVITQPYEGEITPAGRALLARVPAELAVCHAPERKLNPIVRFTSPMPTHLNIGLSMFHEGRKACGKAPAWVVATGPTFDSFIAAFFLARYFRAGLVLDYRDEWTLHPLGAFGDAKADRYWEDRCLRAATLVTHTTPRQMRDHLGKFSFLTAERDVVISNGCDAEELAAAEQTAGIDGARQNLTCLFAGTLGPMNGPAAFLADLGAMLDHDPEWTEKLQIDFVGNNWGFYDDDFARQAKWGIVKQSPAVPKAEVANLVTASDVLLMFNPPQMEKYRPGKLFEYIASNKPLLIHGEGGEIADIVRDLHAGIIVPEGKPEALAAAFRTLLEQPQSVWRSEKRSAWAAAHLRPLLAEQFYALLTRSDA